jgi:hypothetical protein
MNEFLEWMVTTYYGGILSIIFGILCFLWIKKYPSKPENAWFAGDVRGWFAVIFFTLVGLGVIISKLLGKL